MFRIAYLANEFPAVVEPYVGDEIGELRRHGVEVVTGSVRAAKINLSDRSKPGICLEPVRAFALLQSIWLAMRNWKKISDLVFRALFLGKEAPKRRLKTLLHTWLGAYYAVLLREHDVQHIHVHHGYFGSWIGIVAARLSGISFSFTLHGSDLLIDAAYLDSKLKNCRFCLTISEYNRRYILERYPQIDAGKVFVSRLGVDILEGSRNHLRKAPARSRKFILLAVGRLHAVKDHAFLVNACARLRDAGMDFECLIAGEGPERPSLESFIQRNRLQNRVMLLGHVEADKINALYHSGDLVVLTSRSEGIPLVLMEAMARRKIVLAPAITGIPELILPGKTGFLYSPGDLKDFTAKILSLHSLACKKPFPGNRLEWIRHAARVQVVHNFNRETNLNHFRQRFLRQIAPQLSKVTSQRAESASQDWSAHHEDLVLQ